MLDEKLNCCNMTVWQNVFCSSTGERSGGDSTGNGGGPGEESAGGGGDHTGGGGVPAAEHVT